MIMIQYCLINRLKYLNLSNNEIYYIPRLRLLGTSNLQSTVTQNMQNHNGNDRSGGTTSRSISELREDDGLASLSPKLEECVPSDGPLRDGEVGGALEEEGEETSKVGNGRTASAPAIPLRNQTLEHLLIRRKQTQSKSDTNLRSKQSNTPTPKLETTQSQNGMSTTSVPIPGTKSSVPNASPPPNTQRTDRGSPRDVESGGMEGKIEQWSPSEVMMMNQGGSDLFPFPRLETLNLVNNLVSKS